MINAMPAPGVWMLPSHEGANENNNIYWQQQVGAWNVGALMPVMPVKGQALQPQSEVLLSKPLKAGQTAARAAKRQRGRERRKLGKAMAQAQRMLGITQSATPPEELTSGFEARAAKLRGEVKLSIKHTFLAVDAEEEYFEDPVGFDLPAPLFELSRDQEQWRADYRRFRCGFHRGSKGEISDLSDLEMSHSATF